MDGWRMDIGYPEDRDRAEERLQRNGRTEVAAETD
jgi:glucose-1-phosphate thymidylyltransferase